MKIVINRFRQYYKQIKQQPIIVFNRPYLLLLMPLFIYFFFRDRWNTKPEIIYLTETEIAGHNLLLLEQKENFNLYWYNDFVSSEKIILKRINEENNFEKYILETKKRFRLGDSLITLEIENQPAAYVFMSTKKACYTQVHFNEDLLKKFFAVYDVYTFRDFRGKGYYKYLLSSVMKEMQSKQYKYLWLWVMEHNQASVKIHDKLKINHIIRTYQENYKFGIRKFRINHVSKYLNELVEN